MKDNSKEHFNSVPPSSLVTLTNEWKLTEKVTVLG